MILLIDDEAAVSQALADMLTRSGMPTHCAFSAAAGMEMVAEQKPQLIIIDLRLPIVHGAVLGQSIRINPETAEVPILFISGADEDEIKAAIAAVKQVGPAEVRGMQKPIRAAELESVIEDMLAPK